MEYISAKAAADLWGLTKRRVLVLCKEGRIPGAQLIDTMWLIPRDAIKPVDGRSLRYSEKGENNVQPQPLKTSVKAEGHTAQYKMHKYFARRPYNVFSHIIKHYTQKGDIVLDCFCGGGVTVFESAALGRKPIGVDLNPLATFITRMQMFNGVPSELHNFYRRFLLTIEKKYGEWYHVVFPDDQGTLVWVEWVYAVKCPSCGETILLTEGNKQSNGIYFCPNPKCVHHKEGAKRVLCAPAGSVPLRAKYISENSHEAIVREVTLDNMPIFKSTDFSSVLASLKNKPQFAIPNDWDRQHEDKLSEKGVLNYSDFFTDRNYTLNCLIFNEILNLKGTTGSLMNEYLYFLFSSSLRYTNKMTRVTENWEGGKPTAMDKHAFWLPNQYVETNILDVLNQRAKAIVKGCDYAASNLPADLSEVSSFEDMRLRNAFMVLNRSSSDLPIPDESVDIIITDPPYGSNVQYAELSTIWNAWYSIYNGLDSYIFKDEEAVMNRKSNFKGSKSVDDYENLLCSVYTEGARVLKPNGYLVFTFNNKNIKVWVAMLKAVARAGFYLPEDGIVFQDYIDSYKNTAHLRFSGNIQGDFIYSFRKGTPAIDIDGAQGFLALIEESITASLEKLFRRGKTYTTAELYQKILASMTSRLMSYIQWCLSTGTQIEDISELPNDFLDNTLKQRLTYDNGIWRKE